MNIQAKIAEYVFSSGIKRSFIAEKTGYPYNTVRNILSCKKKMTADEFVTFCRVLNKDPMYFINEME